MERVLEVGRVAPVEAPDRRSAVSGRGSRGRSPRRRSCGHPARPAAPRRAGPRARAGRVARARPCRRCGRPRRRACPARRRRRSRARAAGRAGRRSRCPSGSRTDRIELERTAGLEQRLELEALDQLVERGSASAVGGLVRVEPALGELLQGGIERRDRRHRGRERHRAGLGGAQVAREIEVDRAARHLGDARGARGRDEHEGSRPGSPCRHLFELATSRSMPEPASSIGSAPKLETASTIEAHVGAPADLRDRSERVQEARRRLVVHDRNGIDAGIGGERGRHGLGLDRLGPGAVDRHRVDAVRLGDGVQPVAVHAVADHEQSPPRAHRRHDGELVARRAGARDERDAPLVTDARDGAQPRPHPGLERRVLGLAMAEIDAGGRTLHAVGRQRRAGVQQDARAQLAAPSRSARARARRAPRAGTIASGSARRSASRRAGLSASPITAPAPALRPATRPAGSAASTPTRRTSSTPAARIAAKIA